MLNMYLNKKSVENLEKYSKEFKMSKPFNHISITEFLDDKIAQKLLTELKNENYYLEDHDLYQFYRTFDSKNSENKFIKEIRDFLLSTECINYIEKLTNIKLDKTQIDLHSLKLVNTNYLLCHDDDIGNREIAFIINLTKNWKEEYGGKLEFFDSINSEPTKVCKSITPSFNQFNCFKVTPGKSFHQISEVIGDNERISISGWYYKKSKEDKK